MAPARDVVNWRYKARRLLAYFCVFSSFLKCFNKCLRKFSVIVVLSTFGTLPGMAAVSLENAHCKVTTLGQKRSSYIGELPLIGRENTSQLYSNIVVWLYSGFQFSGAKQEILNMFFEHRSEYSKHGEPWTNVRSTCVPCMGRDPKGMCRCQEAEVVYAPLSWHG